VIDDERCASRRPRAKSRSRPSSVRAAERDKSVDVKRLMIDMRVYDRSLQDKMPAGAAIEVELTQKKWWFFHSASAACAR
jgi:hypothetical protein